MNGCEITLKNIIDEYDNYKLVNWNACAPRQEGLLYLLVSSPLGIDIKVEQGRYTGSSLGTYFAEVICKEIDN